MLTGTTEQELFLVDFLAPAQVMPDCGTDFSIQNQASGGKCIESLPQSNPDSYLLRTQKVCDIEDLPMLSGALPKSGMWVNGNVYQQPTLERPTKEKGYLSLPTPTASSGKSSRPSGRTKCEQWFKDNGLIPNSRQLSSEMMALIMGFPPDWTECLTAFPRIHQEESVVATSTDARSCQRALLLPSVESNSFLNGGEMLDTWNPAHFGDVPRIIEGDQLTIFYDDSHEPPDPDDYTTVEDYERAWAKWEINNQSKNKSMNTFQFSQTEQISNQIAQLQEQLNQLTASLQPYRECEEKAEQIRQGVAEWSSEMASRGIVQNDIFKWAKALYSAGCGKEFVEGDNSEIKASLENAIIQRNEALAKASRLEALAENIVELQRENKDLKDSNKVLRVESEQLKRKIESYVVEVRELDSYVGDIKRLEKENDNYQKLYDGQKAQKEQWESDFYKIRAEYNQLKKELKKVDLQPASELQPLAEPIKDDEKSLPDTKQKKLIAVDARIVGRNFINGIKTKVGMNNIAWVDVSKVCAGSTAILREMCLTATTKYQKEFIEKLPHLLADYISETGDITDMTWVGNILKSKVEELLAIKKSYLYHSNDWVREIETGEIWQVKDFDGEWLQVKNDNKITSLHKLEVELVGEKLAAAT